jgi:hypothetical protein
MDIKLKFSVFLIFISLNVFGQISTLNTGKANRPEGTESMLVQRHRALRAIGGSPEKEIYVGVDNVEHQSNRSESDLSYSNTIHFTLQYSPLTNTVTATTRIMGMTVRTEKTDISSSLTAAGKSIDPGEMNFMELQVRTQNAASAIDIHSMTLDGKSITGMYGRNQAAGTSYWNLSDYHFGGGFTLTGTIIVTGAFGSSAESNKVEFLFGSQPGGTPQSLVWGNVQVSKNEMGKNELKWTTLRENSSDHFLVQRAEDGKPFAEIRKIKAKGSTSQESDYAVTDEPGNSKTRYRIVEVARNGKVSYSKVVSLDTSVDASTVFYDGGSTVHIYSGHEQQRMALIVDANGRLVLRTPLRQSISSLDVGSLQRGIYFVKVEGEKSTTRFLKL